ncbi:hypothetical protein [Tahibacter soli]|uniref:YD repeat-containing protein n=1 Tax=Tahibacter soli TaxID=2983605 RepID=A0A9X3YP56_9GAMM|nr:hypothetical protein [Tahibacter soli]MDC8014373.1 hypothetical protein [Tahibacter soli]
MEPQERSFAIRSRAWPTGLAAALALSLAAHAQSSPDPLALRGSASVPAYVEYDKKVRASEQLSPLSGELFGEDVSSYTGATEFSHVDIDIPGNNALPVQLRRRFVVSALVPDQAHDPRGGPGNAFGGLANWDIEVPYVYGTFDSHYGWNIPLGASSQQPRCSQNFAPRKTAPNVTIRDVWSGNKVHIPGRGDKEILRLDASYPPLQYPTDGRAPTWSTSEFDAFACTPHAVSSNGEGFAMTTPAGITYTFDVYRERAYASVEAGGNTNLRKVVYLLASSIADRYGNAVTYTYDDVGRPTSIRDNGGGREIRLTYDATSSRLLTSASVTVAIPGQSTQTRTWRYAYENGADGLPRLKTVTLPDTASQWIFDYHYNAPGDPDPVPDTYLYVQYLPPKPSNNECAAATFQPARFSMRITHPSGANGDFRFAMGRQQRTVPQPNCPTGGGQFLKTPYVDTYSLASKTLSDTADTSSTWRYAYAIGTCTRCTNTVMTQPGNSGTVTYRFSNVYGATLAGTTPAGSAIEGQLLDTITRDSNNAELNRVANTYVTGVDLSGIPLTGYPFPARYGLGGGGDDPSSGSVRPLKSVVTTQQGVTFTKLHKTFDALARPLEVERSSPLGTKTETTAYVDDKQRWILGLVDTVTNDVLPLNPVVDNRYDALGNLIEVTVVRPHRPTDDVERRRHARERHRRCEHDDARCVQARHSALA